VKTDSPSPAFPGAVACSFIREKKNKIRAEEGALKHGGDHGMDQRKKIPAREKTQSLNAIYHASDSTPLAVVRKGGWLPVGKVSRTPINAERSVDAKNSFTEIPEVCKGVRPS